MGAQLIGVLCPHCGARTHTMCVESGPQLVRHEREWTANGERRRCRGTWIAVPNAETRAVELVPVEGRKAIDDTLKSATERWLIDRAMESRAAFADIFCGSADD